MYDVFKNGKRIGRGLSLMDARLMASAWQEASPAACIEIRASADDVPDYFRKLGLTG